LEPRPARILQSLRQPSIEPPGRHPALKEPAARPAGRLFVRRRTATGKLQKFVIREAYWQGVEQRVG
jgi:hypothetical protein